MRSRELTEFAGKYMAGGVSSSIRINRAIGRPLFMARGDGPKVWDVDGNEMYDLNNSHGATILGHNHPKLRAAVEKGLDMGVICSYETEYQSQLAQTICSMVPAMERVRYTCSGTEATMHLTRLAREITGKDKIIKFEGHFHGYHDYVQFSSSPPLDKAGPPDAPTPYCQSGGIPDIIADLIIVVPFNDLDALEKAIRENKDEAAAVILEPINYNSGCIVPSREYMEALRRLTIENDVLLIFDEVLSAFRTNRGCAQEYFQVVPDLCAIGKCVAGGYPLSVFGGKQEFMDHVRPKGRSEHSGTYNGHLIPVLAALACLEEIDSPGFFEYVNQLADRFYSGLDQIFRETGLGRVQGLGARFGMYFGIDGEVTNYREAAKSDPELSLKFTAAAINNGVYIADYGGKAAHHGFSTAYTPADVDEVLNRLQDAARQIMEG